MRTLKRIKTFKFDIDKDLDTEILMNDQVFADLQDLKNILGEQAQPNLQ